MSEHVKRGDPNQALPTDSAGRKAIPMARGLLDYFPAALAAVAEVSRMGNEKHNPGEELHHARGKSMDHADCIIRHLVDRGGVDAEGVKHSASVAWRALALLQEELEAEGAPLARGARLPTHEEPISQWPDQVIASNREFERHPRAQPVRAAGERAWSGYRHEGD